jgi:hypothetical protein
MRCQKATCTIGLEYNEEGRTMNPLQIEEAVWLKVLTPKCCVEEVDARQWGKNMRKSGQKTPTRIT